MLSAILAVGCWWWFRRAWEREPRRLRVAVLALAMRYTSLGRRIRAVVQNRDLDLAEAIDAGLVSHSDEKLFAAYMRCFPL